jgi:NosR/NirI family nitrous oxide reductase transcriptional regulator
MAAPRELPLAGPSRPAAKPLTPGLRFAISSYRAGVVLAAVAILYFSQPVAEDSGPAAVSLAQAQRVFPTAERLGKRAPQQNSHPVLDGAGNLLGTVLRTSPDTDDLIGYSGPSDLVVGLNPTGGVEAVRLLTSQDTPSHVDAVNRSASFWSRFQGWKPAEEPLPSIDAVSGSTLTSLALAEAIERRLTGAAHSLRFPDPVSLEEVRELFPAADCIQQGAPRLGWAEVLSSERRIGYVVRTSPQAETVRGYGGPTEALAAISADRQQLLGVRMRQSYDTPEYVERVREDAGYWATLSGRSVRDWAEIDFQKAGIEGVSGATQTSFAVAEGLRRRLAADLAAESQPSLTETIFFGWRIRPREIGLAAIVIGALGICFTRLKGDWRVRFAWQLLLVLGFGAWFGDLFSLALVAGWSRNGSPWRTSPGLVLLVVVALVTPWGTKKQVYCHFLCPHGVLQEWLGRFRRLQLRLPDRWLRRLGWFPGALLAAALLLAVARPSFNLTAIEPFDAWSLRQAAGISAWIAAVGLLASLFIPQAYCRFGCPSGALFKLLQSHGGGERIGLRDILAGLVVLCAAAIAGWTGWRGSASMAPVKEPRAIELTGHSRLGAWRVRFRKQPAEMGQIAAKIEQELETLENAFAASVTTSETAQFSSSATTLELEFSAEFVALLANAQKLSVATDGALDVTRGPRDFSRLTINAQFNTVQKQVPEQAVDLDALLIGKAVDRIGALLSGFDVGEFLIEFEGRRLARGAWMVGNDDAKSNSAIAALESRDQAAAELAAQQLIVYADNAETAGGWATALAEVISTNGEARAMEIAARERLQGRLRGRSLLPAAGK